MSVEPDQPLRNGIADADLVGTRGRRFRTFCRLVHWTNNRIERYSCGIVPWGIILECDGPPTFGRTLQMILHDEKAYAMLTDNPLRTGSYVESMLTNVPTEWGMGSSVPNATLHPALQDLADEIIFDLVDACEAFDHPDLYYPGVDPPLIEPMSDDHVRLVIWATKRELIRETSRLSRGQTLKTPPLEELPWGVQRAFAERRRFRYAQWGIGAEQWKSNVWSLWDVADDPEWEPQRVPVRD